MKVKKSKYKLEDFLQVLSNGKKVFDFNKIAEKNFPIVILQTERGRLGKTLNIKEFLRQDFNKLVLIKTDNIHSALLFSINPMPPILQAKLKT